MEKFTVQINIDLDSLKKAYARYHGLKNWKKVKRSEIADWIASLAESDIECDLVFKS